MIKLRRFRGGGAFTYDFWDINLADQGIVFVKGENLDAGGSNGSGKSTPFEILEHILFGKTSKGLKKNSIISLNPSSDEGYFAELELEKDGTFWFIRESRSHTKYGTKLKIFKKVGDEWEDNTPKNNPGKDDARKFITEHLIPHSHSEFHGCVYLAQRATHVLVNGTPGERSTYLSRLFGLERYDDLKAEIDDEFKEVSNKLSDLLSLEGQAEAVHRRMEELPSEDTLVHSKEILQQARTHGDDVLAEAEETKTSCTRKLDQLRRRRELLQKADQFGFGDDLRFVKEEITRIRDEIKTTQEQEIDPVKGALASRRRYDKLCARLEDMGEPERSSSALQEAIEQLAAERERLKALLPSFEKKERLSTRIASMEGLSALREDPDALAAELESLQNDRIRAKDTVSRCKKELEQHVQLDAATCPTCGQDLDQDNIQRMISDLEEEIANARAVAIQAKNRIPEIKESLEQIEAYGRAKQEFAELPELPDIDVDEEITTIRARLKEAKADLTSAQEYEKVKAEIANIELPDKDTESLELELKSATITLDELQERRDSLMSARQLLDQAYAIEEVDELPLKRSLAIASEILRDVKQARMDVEAQWAVVKEQSRSLNQCRQELERINEKMADIDAIRRRHRLLQCLSKAVPKLKRRQLRQIVSAVHDVLPKYTSVMFTERPPVNFIVKDDENSIDILMERTVKDEDTGTSVKVHIPINAISGGEQKRLSVSLLFTLHDVLASTKRVDLLVLDEVDSGLDDLGVDALMRIVDHCKRSYGTVIMTSHRPQISGSVFDQVWTVRKENNVSRIHTED